MSIPLWNIVISSIYDLYTISSVSILQYLQKYLYYEVLTYLFKVFVLSTIIFQRHDYSDNFHQLFYHVQYTESLVSGSNYYSWSFVEHYALIIILNNFFCMAIDLLQFYFIFFSYLFIMPLTISHIYLSINVKIIPNYSWLVIVCWVWCSNYNFPLIVIY
jgi:hypothetical protein